jgi:hypothetical protein
VREFKPKWKYHATLAPKLVCSRQEERDLGPGWSDQYQHQEYPKCVYHPTKAPDGKIVKNLDEHKALGKGWYATPGDFPQTRAVAGQTVGEQADNKEVPAGIRDRRGTRMSCEASITPTAMQPLGQREREPKDAVKREDVLKRELNYAVESGQEHRSEGDPWEERIADWAQSRDTISIDEVLASCLHQPPAQWTQADRNRVARSLRALGWKRFQRRHGKIRDWRYRRTQ